MSTHHDELSKAFDRLSAISSHDALVLLKTSLSTPKLMHMLRASPCTGHVGLSDIDSTLRAGLCKTFNVSLSDAQWLQASLPVKSGGLGIRQAHHLAPSAFAASIASTRQLQQSILNSSSLDLSTHEIQAHEMWSEMSNTSVPTGTSAFVQKNWDKPIISELVSTLTSTLSSDKDRARFLAVSAPLASAWLNALPIAACGLRLDDNAIRVAIGLRLGTPICMPHACPCSEFVDEVGSHMLSCKRSSARMGRHASLNDEIHRSLVKAGDPAIKEPPGLLRTYGKRPDGVTQVPWAVGKCLTWDVTACDTLAPSYMPLSSVSAGSAAERAASRKMVKYSQLLNTYNFIPIAFETLGAINSEGSAFLRDLGRRLTLVTGEIRESNFLIQRLSIIIQRYNAVALHDSFILNSSPSSQI